MTSTLQLLQFSSWVLTELFLKVCLWVLVYSFCRPTNWGKVRRDTICLWAFSETAAQSIQKSCSLAPRPPRHLSSGKERDSRDQTKVERKRSKLSRSSLIHQAPQCPERSSLREEISMGWGVYGNQANPNNLLPAQVTWWRRQFYFYKELLKICNIFSLFSDNRAMTTDLLLLFSGQGHRSLEKAPCPKSYR